MNLDNETRRDAPWILWLTASAASFLAIEIAGLRSPKQERTFSSFTRRLLGIRPQRRGHRLSEVAFLVAVLYFTAHILNRHEEQC